MVIRDMACEVQDKIPVQNVLTSVYDKTNLDFLVNELMAINPNVVFMSTGGTYKKIGEILGKDYDKNLMEVAEYTGFPEMEGGLVKTLHPKIHAGLLGERNNEKHQEYVKNLGNGVFFDLVVVNLYPFENVSHASDVTFEKARGNIDIGGPTMLRAAGKNFPNCAVLCDPSKYINFIQQVRNNGNCTTFDQRFNLAQDVFLKTFQYEEAISAYFGIQNVKEVRKNYNIK
jgi:phosphoribosylaminoimidazolecarboxamide formyltransferase/IMP cyclohydrolase